MVLHVSVLGAARVRRPPRAAPQAEEAPAALGCACCRRLACCDHLLAWGWGEACAQLAILPLDMLELERERLHLTTARRR